MNMRIGHHARNMCSLSLVRTTRTSKGGAWVHAGMRHLVCERLVIVQRAPELLLRLVVHYACGMHAHHRALRGGGRGRTVSELASSYSYSYSYSNSASQRPLWPVGPPGVGSSPRGRGFVSIPGSSTSPSSGSCSSGGGLASSSLSHHQGVIIAIIIIIITRGSSSSS